jgi:hypothetical protein
MVPSEGIPDGLFLDQIHLSSEDPCQFLLSAHDIEETPFCVILEYHQHIHIAVRMEVIPERRAKDSQFLDPPSPAGLCNSVLRDLYSHAYVHTSTGANILALKTGSSALAFGMNESPFMMEHYQKKRGGVKISKQKSFY